MVTRRSGGWLITGGMALLLCAHPVRAQQAPEEKAILSVVKQLFDGMRRSDSAMIRSTLHPGALLATAVVRLDKAGVEFDTVDAFLKAVATPHDSVWDERIRNPIVHRDGTLAVVWAEYRFYVGSRFNHCGVDTFTLARVNDAWKVVSLVDTRRRQPCPEPKT